MWVGASHLAIYDLGERVKVSGSTLPVDATIDSHSHMVRA